MDNIKEYKKPKKPVNPNTVLVFGTFDILHPGHLSFFGQARAAAGENSRLVVVVAKDFNSKQAKGIFPLNNERLRLENIKKLINDGIVDEAMLGESTDKFSVIKKIKPDVICIGYDQKIPEGFDEWISKQSFKPKIITLKAHNPDRFKSSKFRS